MPTVSVARTIGRAFRAVTLTSIRRNNKAPPWPKLECYALTSCGLVPIRRPYRECNAIRAKPEEVPRVPKTEVSHFLHTRRAHVEFSNILLHICNVVLYYIERT